MSNPGTGILIKAMKFPWPVSNLVNCGNVPIDWESLLYALLNNYRCVLHTASEMLCRGKLRRCVVDG